MLSPSKDNGSNAVAASSTQEIPVIAIHAKFGASKACYAKDEEIYGESESLPIASTRSSAERLEVIRFSLTEGVRFAPFTCPAIFSGSRAARIIVSPRRRSWTRPRAW